MSEIMKCEEWEDTRLGSGSKPVIFAGIAQILPDQQKVRLEGAEGILIEDGVTGVSALLLYISLRSGLEIDEK